MPQSKKQKRKKQNRRRRRGLGRALRSVARNPAVRRAMGHFADRAFTSLVGSGDYGDAHINVGGGFDLKENTVVKTGKGAEPPLINADHDAGRIRIRHREYLRDINTGTSPGTLYQFPIDCTSPDVFPWLSSIANRFEQWIPHGMVFEFVSTCGNAIAGTSAALGSVSMATQYNVNEAGLFSKQDMLNHFFSTSTKSSESAMHAIECADDQLPYKLLWTGTDQPAGLVEEDERLSALGLFQIITQGSPGVYTAGELWVTYDVSLLKPRLPNNGPTGPTVGQLIALRTREGVIEDEADPPLQRHPAAAAEGSEVLVEPPAPPKARLRAAR